MKEYLYCYLMALNEKKYEAYSCEILKISEDCIKAYDSTKGVFLHYFNAAWKKEYSHICGRNIIEEHLQGMTKITLEEKRAIVGLIRYRAKAQNGDELLNEEEILLKYSQLTGIPLEKIRYIATIENTKIINNQITDNEGNTQNIIEQVPDKVNIEDICLSKENTEEIFIKLECAFQKLQERQKPLISDLLTAKLCDVVFEELKENRFTFVSHSVLENYISFGKIPSQKEIGLKYGKVEASVSRAYKNFLLNINLYE